MRNQYDIRREEPRAIALAAVRSGADLLGVDAMVVVALFTLLCLLVAL